MEPLIAFLDHGWVGSVIGVLGALLGVIGIVAAVWTYRASQIGARPVYQMRSLPLIGVPDSLLAHDVEVLFRGQRVERLTKTQIIFWNAGKRTIEGSNIVASDPLKISFSRDSTIVDANITRYSRLTNNAKIDILSENMNILILDFDYFDPEDGVAIEILHTDSRVYPSISGTIRGIPGGIIDGGIIKTPHKIKFKLPFFSFSFNKKRFPLLLITIFMISGLYLLFEGRLKTQDIVVYIVGLLIFAMEWVDVWLSRRRYPLVLGVHDLESKHPQNKRSEMS